MALLEDMPIPRHEIGVELIYTARETRRGGVVWRWVRMACLMLKMDSSAEEGGRSRGWRRLRLPLLLTAGRSPFSKPPYPAPTVSCPRPQAWTAGKLENRRRSGVAPWQGGGLHAQRVRVVS